MFVYVQPAYRELFKEKDGTNECIDVIKHNNSGRRPFLCFSADDVLSTNTPGLLIVIPLRSHLKSKHYFTAQICQGKKDDVYHFCWGKGLDFEKMMFCRKTDLEEIYIKLEDKEEVHNINEHIEHIKRKILLCIAHYKKWYEKPIHDLHQFKYTSLKYFHEYIGL